MNFITRRKENSADFLRFFILNDFIDILKKLLANVLNCLTHKFKDNHLNLKKVAILKEILLLQQSIKILNKEYNQECI